MTMVINHQSINGVVSAHNLFRPNNLSGDLNNGCVKKKLPSFHCSSWPFQTVSIHFHVYYAVPNKKVRKMKKLFSNTIKFKKNNIYIDLFYFIYTRILHKTEIPVS